MNKQSNRILVVEDSKFYSSIIQKRIEKEFGLVPVSAKSMRETLEILENESDFFVAIVDLYLPDSPNGEVVDAVISRQIPSIVLSGNINKELRDRIISKNNIVDYILKSESEGLETAMELIGKLIRNQCVKVLIVDDSPVQRHQLKKLLRLQKYELIEAESGEAAIELFERHDDILVVITDYQMPGMDGHELVSRLRKVHGRDQLSIIGISSSEEPFLSAKFLKTGANDFLTKPIMSEELTARLAQNVDMLLLLKKLKELSTTDVLTQLHNRRSFFEKVKTLLAGAKDNENSIALGAIDIDGFKNINDEHGHAAGDKYLQALAAILIKNIRGADIAARLGGDEFSVVLVDMDLTRAEKRFEAIRREIEKCEVYYKNTVLKATVSIGVVCDDFDSLDEMLNCADELMYAAKTNGKNKVVAK